MIHALLVVALLAAPVAAADRPAADSPHATVGTEPCGMVFLVRHAEAEAEGDDPPLTAAGRARAEALARVLGDAGVERVLSTDFRRTRETAAPIAAALGLEVEIYDPRDLPGLVEALDDRRGRVLIVGHSNTTPEVVRLLGGDPGPPVDHHEHDRLYVVTRPAAAGGEGAVGALLRYGGE